MTKRELTKEEKEITEKQLLRHKENKDRLVKSLEYNKAVVDMNRKQRDFNETWNEYKRDLKEEEEEKSLKLIADEIGNIEEHITQLTTELKEGVEQKPHVGVG